MAPQQVILLQVQHASPEQEVLHVQGVAGMYGRSGRGFLNKFKDHVQDTMLLTKFAGQWQSEQTHLTGIAPDTPAQRALLVAAAAAMGFCSAPFPCDSATAQQQAGRFAKPDLNTSCTHPGMSTSGRQGCLAYLLPWSYGRSHVQLPGGECCPSAAGPVLQQQCQYTGGTWPPVGPQKLYTPPHMLCGPWPSSAELL